MFRVISPPTKVNGVAACIRRAAGDFIGTLHTIRPFLKLILPFSLHRAAGRLGRAVVRRLDDCSLSGSKPHWQKLVLPEEGIQWMDEQMVLVSDGLQAGGAER